MVPQINVYSNLPSILLLSSCSSELLPLDTNPDSIPHVLNCALHWVPISRKNNHDLVSEYSVVAICVVLLNMLHVKIVSCHV